MKRKIFSALFLSLFIGSSMASTSLQGAFAATSPKAGATCSKAGKTATYKNKKFTCIKSGKKLVWNKGVSIPKPVSTLSPVPMKSASPSPSPSQTPSLSASPSASILPPISPSASASATAPPSANASPSASNSPSVNPSLSPKTSESPVPSASTAPSPKTSTTPTQNVEPLPHAGSVIDPQPINSFLNRNGIKIKVIKVTDEVSELVCKTELIHEGCDFGGAVDSDSESRFVEIVITVNNDGTETWIPAIFGLYLDDEYYGGDFIVDGDIPGVFELEVGQTVTLKSYVAIPKDIKIGDCLFFISESSSEEAFYIEVK